MKLHRATVVALVALGTLVGASCGDGGSGPRAVRTRDLPVAADAIVFRIDARGGYTPVEYQLAIVPQLSVYGDGRVVVTGPVTEQYPPHALPVLLTGTLSRDEMTRLAALADELDVLRPADFGQPGVSDLPTTVVTVAVDGTHAHEVYALDFGADDAPGLTAPQREVRSRLTQFTGALGAAVDRVATEPFVASEVAVYVTPAPDDATTDFSVAPGHADWPLAGPLATIGSPSPDEPGVDPVFRCAVLSGTDARATLAAAATATSITHWRSGGAEYVVVFRPLMPDEHACP